MARILAWGGAFGVIPTREGRPYFAALEERESTLRKTDIPMRAEARPQRDDDDDDEWYAQQRRERALKALNGRQQPPVAAPPKKTATEVVEAWVEAHEAEGVSRNLAIAELRKRDPKLVKEWVAEFNAKHGR